MVCDVFSREAGVLCPGAGMQQVGNVAVLRAKQLLDGAVLGGAPPESVLEEVLPLSSPAVYYTV